mgnify:CR=1 FL=1
METKITTLPQLSFAEAVKLNFARITEFKGRSRRSELWWNYLMYVILTFCLSLLLGNGNLIVLAIISFFLQLVIVPVTIRRMHDGGHSGIWVVAAVLLNVATNVYGFMKGFASLGDLSPEEVITVISNPAFIGLSLASMVVEIVIFIFAVMDGDKGENKYGASTKYIVETVEEAAE